MMWNLTSHPQARSWGVTDSVGVSPQEGKSSDGHQTYWHVLSYEYHHQRSCHLSLVSSSTKNSQQRFSQHNITLLLVWYLITSTGFFTWISLSSSTLRWWCKCPLRPPPIPVLPTPSCRTLLLATVCEDVLQRQPQNHNAFSSPVMCTSYCTVTLCITNNKPGLPTCVVQPFCIADNTALSGPYTDT